MVPFRVLSRTNLADSSRRSSLNSRPFNRLQPLCASFPTPVLCFQSLAASFPKTPGVGVPSRPSGRSHLQTFRRSDTVSPFLPIASLQPKQFQAIAHSFPQRRQLICRSFNNLRTLLPLTTSFFSSYCGFTGHAFTSHAPTKTKFNG